MRKKNGSERRPISRRALLASGGLGVLGSGLLGGRALGAPVASWGPGGGDAGCGVEVPPFQRKTPVLPGEGSRDVVEHARAEMLFWNDIMMEHGLFMAILMPTADAAVYRGRALRFQRTFADRIGQMRQSRMDRDSLAGVIRSNNELVKQMVDFKLELREQQLAGRIRTLIWPHFLSHVAHEGQRFMRRLEAIGKGEVALESSEVVGFWTTIMGEHAQFISQLLDPQEVELIRKSDQLARTLFAATGSPAGSVESLAEEVVNFKEAAENGILSGQIKSIILPALVDHVRREAVKFVDELKRL